MCTRFLTRILHSLRLRKRPAATISVCTRAENVFHGSHWGHESDENDETWLWLGFLFESNTEGVRLSEAGKKGEHCAARDVPTMRTFSLTDVCRLGSCPQQHFTSILRQHSRRLHLSVSSRGSSRRGRSCRKESSGNASTSSRWSTPDRSVDPRRLSLRSRCWNGPFTPAAGFARSGPAPNPKPARQMALFVHARSCSGTVVRLGPCRCTISSHHFVYHFVKY